MSNAPHPISGGRVWGGVGHTRLRKTATVLLWILMVWQLQPAAGQGVSPSHPPTMQESREQPVQLDPRLRELGEHISALRPVVDSAQRAAQRADSSRADSLRQAREVPVDTLQVGPLTIVTVPAQGDLARSVFGQVWDLFQPLLRGSEDLLDDHVFVFQYGWRLGGIYPAGEHIHNVQMSRRFGMDKLENKARDALGQALVQSLPSQAKPLGNWVGMTPLNPPRDWSWIYRELVSTPSLAARKCYQGEVAWCWDALGVPRGDGGWESWYTPEERRLLVESRFKNRLVHRGVFDKVDLLTHGCVSLQSDAACIEVLENWPGRVPLGATVRASMVAEALTQGGEGAFSRLVQGQDTAILQRLAQAAGMSPDSLATRWRERVLAARPNNHAGLLRSPASLFLWILLLLFFATRSTTRRLG